MKVIIITDAWHPQVNGVVRTYEHLSEELRKLGHTVKVVGPGSFPFSTPMPGYPEIRLAVMPYKHLKKIINEFNPDCIHIPTEGPLGWAARKYCRKHKKKFSTSYHTHFPDYVAKRVGFLAPFLYKFAYARAKSTIRKFHDKSSRIMIATQSVEDILKDWGFKAPMHRVSRGANLDIFKTGEKTLFKDMKQPIALYVGRVAIEKNIEDFLKMAWDGSKIIVGDGPRLYEFQHKYPDYHFVGRKQGEELAHHYKSSDIFIFPSKTDTFGIVIIEAMASGLPVVGYNVTGPKDIITKPFLGAITDGNLSEAAHKALQCGTPKEREKYAKDHYSWGNAAKQFEAGLVQNSKTVQ